MMCKDGVVKVTDFGLAAYSLLRDEDPWTRKTNVKSGVLCASFEGGTQAYFSSEQHKISSEWEKVRGEEARDVFNDSWRLTVATSDLYQAAMTIFEMHALYLPSAAGSSTSTPFDAAIKCAARTPESEFVKFSPKQTESWLAGRSNGPRLLEEGALIDKGFGGEKLLELSKSDWKEAKEVGVFRLLARFRKLQAAVQRDLSNDTNGMHPSIATLLKGDGSSTKEVRELSPEQTEKWLEERKIAMLVKQAEGLKEPQEEENNALQASRLQSLIQRKVGHQYEDMRHSKSVTEIATSMTRADMMSFCNGDGYDSYDDDSFLPGEQWCAEHVEEVKSKMDAAFAIFPNGLEKPVSNHLFVIE